MVKMNLVFAVMLLLSIFVNAQSQKNEINNYVPDEIIVQYKTTGSQSVRGQAILSEHQEVIKTLNQFINNSIVKYSPVFKYTISEMIRNNETESAVISKALQKRYEKKLQQLKKSGILYKQNLPQNISVPDQNFSRSLVIKITDRNKLDNIIQDLKGFRNSQFEITNVEPNYIYRTYYTPADSLYSSQWSHKKTEAEAAWDITQGDPNIIIGILDSGIDLLHEDLVDNIIPGYDFVDVDTTSYKSPFQSLYPGEDYTTPDSIPMDYFGHGTHCAGIAAARNNNTGVIGVAPKCSIMPIRAGFGIITVDRGEISLMEEDDIANGIQFAVLNGVDILSMSFGSNWSTSLLENQIDFAASHGIILVAAAGNDNNNAKTYPSGYKNVISVAATDEPDAKAFYSNYGSWVNVAAPGDLILSTVPKSGSKLTNPSGYAYLSGTSMAAPYVAGIAGLILSKNPGWKPDEVKRIIMKGVDAPSENSKYIGTGRVNVKKALQINTLSNAAAEITYPVFNSVVTGNCTITGKVTGNSYSLYWGLGLYPKEWNLIASGSIPVDDKLGVFNIEGLPDATCSLKLVSSDGDGQNEFQIPCRILRAAFVSKPLNNFPVTLYGGSEYYTADSKPVIFDINSDGKNEIICISNGTVHVFNSDGKDIPGWPIFTGGDKSWFTPAIADLDGDGLYEILAVSSTSWYINYPGTSLNIWNCEGKRIPYWKQPLPFNSWLRSPTVGDIDNDTNPEIILNDYDGWIYIYSSHGELKWKKRLFIDGTVNENLNTAIADINNDGFMELICCSYNANVYILDHLGNQINSFFVNSGTYEIALCDLNKDSKYEAVLPLGSNISTCPKGIGVWDMRGKKIFATNFANDETYSTAIGDINNDSYPEIVFFVSTSNQTYVIDRLGRTLSGWPRVSNSSSPSRSNIIINDINNDGFNEIILGFNNGDIIIYNHDGTLYSVTSTGNFVSAIAAGDIDQDNIYELLCHSYDGKLYGWKLSDTPGDMKQNSNTWPMFQHDIHHSGNYHYVVPARDTTTNVADVRKIPLKYSLYQNFPNPFNPVTQIRFDLPEACEVKLEIYNILGECVKQLINEMKPAGHYEISFDAGNLSSSIYIYKLTAGKFTASKKMILLK